MLQCTSSPHDGFDRDTLFKNADSACRLAKKTGKNRTMVYHASSTGL